MSDTSPILSLPYIQPSQAQKHVTHNEALQRLDVLTQTVVQDRGRTAPPAPAQTGNSHIVAPGATGDWAGRDGQIATWDGTGWQFIAPRTGWQAQVLDEARAVIHDGSGWAAQPPDLNDLSGVGIGTQADPVNRLAVTAQATLLSHDGAGHQLKINKSTAPDTASLLFQTGWSGRAEMGTAGSDGFAIKVSPDGSAWNVGLQIDPDNGQTLFPSGAGVDGALTGTAVQQTPDDTTPGRLMRADYGYGPGSLLGPVGLAGGVPTGGVIERGTTPDGDFVRFADGTQICTHALELDFLNAGKMTGTWTYPAAFTTASGLFVSGMINVSSFNQNVTGPGLDEVLDIRFGTLRADQVLAQMFRLPGATGFAAGDHAECRLLALGRWD
jgi:hypothetical protein